MSAALVRQSLELFGYTSQEKKKKQRKKQNQEIDIPKLGVNKGIESKSASKHKKLTVYKAKQLLQSQTDPTERNVEKLLKLSTNKTYKGTTNRIIKKIAVKQSKLQKEKPVKQEESSVMTEEDIKLFMDEYNNLN